MPYPGDPFDLIRPILLSEELIPAFVEMSNGMMAVYRKQMPIEDPKDASWAKGYINGLHDAQALLIDLAQQLSADEIHDGDEE